MQIPTYYLPRPPLQLTGKTRAACDSLLAHSLSHSGIDLTGDLPAPAWKFLSYLTDEHEVVLHGSNNPAISEFMPRQSNDTNPFGNRCRIYAASDGIWPMFFAILNRSQYSLSLSNTCVRLITPVGLRSNPYYYFSITQSALPHQPWQQGTIYILPRASFEPSPPSTKNGIMYQTQEWASATPVQPYAKLTVEPDDFPFLAQIRGHDPEIIQQRAQADPNGWPWLDDPESKS
jgi:hypothetical protein